MPAAGILTFGTRTRLLRRQNRSCASVWVFLRCPTRYHGSKLERTIICTPILESRSKSCSGRSSETDCSRDVGLRMGTILDVAGTLCLNSCQLDARESVCFGLRRHGALQFTPHNALVHGSAIPGTCICFCEPECNRVRALVGTSMGGVLFCREFACIPLLSAWLCPDVTNRTSNSVHSHT
ncbi:hypothetical protein LMG29542_04268 [Paraburkholderia humisilvae]|uniref:Uncharacterized protein n=1 Tax=Paraburkholderia humisilvae TaxID=627669 RepID=A0A6J5E755_9BURK|nr:hypothetical protein LMG29542_04268 [Paraburkholderia humisilvae]